MAATNTVHRAQAVMVRQAHTAEPPQSRATQNQAAATAVPAVIHQVRISQRAVRQAKIMTHTMCTTMTIRRISTTTTRTSLRTTRTRRIISIVRGISDKEVLTMCKFDPFDLNRDGVVDGADAFLYDEFFGDEENDDDDDDDEDDW